MKDKTVVITGASDGIGAEAARELHALGAKVVVVGRSKSKTEAVANELHAPHFVADFAKLSEVRSLADWLLKNFQRIDVLANNAGGIFGNREITEDGHEKTMQVNHLAPFLLTVSLIDQLLESQASIINTSSVASKFFSDFHIDDLEVANHYSPTKAYGNAKLENILFTKELHRRYHDQGISVAALHPGNVSTNFASETNHVLRWMYHTPLRHILLISPARGADTLVWLASTTPGVDWQSGEYYEKRKISESTDLLRANDAALAKELWDRSVEFVEPFLPTATKPS